MPPSTLQFKPEAYQAAAEAIHGSYWCTVDSGTPPGQAVTPSCDGAWVRAWFYIEHGEAEAYSDSLPTHLRQ